MDSIPPTGPPAGQAPPQPLPTASDPITQTVLDLADRLAAAEADTANRFESMRAAFADLRSRLEAQQRGVGISIPDDPARRLREFLGYGPSPEQQIELFTAYAAWHATEPKLQENRSAEYVTKKGQTISYGYADLAGVISAAQSAAAHGLCALTRQEFDDNGHPIVTGYLVHSSGGAISSGPVPLFVGESDRRGQAHAAGLTTCRRLALQMVLGLAAERDDDFNSSAETSPARGSGTRPTAAPPRPSGERPMANPPRRVVDATARPAATTRQGPPPGWLSKEERAALEQELMDPAITPQRFQEIEERLLAAKPTATAGPATP